MFDSQQGSSGGEYPKAEEPPEAMKRLLTEDDVSRFLGGKWPVNDGSDYLDDGAVSDDEKPRNGWPPSGFLPGSHFLEGVAPQTDVLPFFEMVLPPPLVEMMVNCTNQSAEILKVIHNKCPLYVMWKPVTEMEFRVFLGLLYHMEDVKMKRLGDYWKKTRLFNITIFHNMMEKRRFLGILGALSFNILVPPPDENTLRADRLYRVRPLMDHLNNLISSLHFPGIESLERSLDNFKENPLFAHYQWHKRIGIYILHTLLEIGTLIFNDQFPQEKMTPDKFRLKVVDGLLPSAPLPASGEDMPVLHAGDKPHYMSYIGINEKGKKRRKRCKYCMDVRNKRKESYFCCSGCSNNPGFCIDGCFAKYHGYC